MKILTKKPIYTLILSLCVFFFSSAQIENQSSKKLIYKFDIKEQIAKPVWRTTQMAFEEAIEKGADIIIIHMNTYGGQVDMADSIRTKILNSKIPVYVFIDDNAASAGALISIACDSIYMKPGGKIGAATVVNQSGEQVPDKYQSYMRATMRATAEAKGKDTIISGQDTIIQWRRDPAVAEAMVDPSIFVPEISDTGKVLTFTAEEALRYNFNEAIVNNIADIIEHAGIQEYELIEHEKSFTDIIIGLLLSPVLHSLLIMGIVGGLYFELQSPGIGFPLAISILSAVLYFAPLYLQGLAENWELAIFVLGVVLIAVEIFAIPGFGVAGASGILLIISGLTLALIDNLVFDTGNMTLIVNVIFKAFGLVIISLFGSLILSLYIGKELFTSKLLHLALNKTQKKEEGYIGVDISLGNLVGKEGIAHTVLRPSGQIEIEGNIYDAISEIGYIDKKQKIKVNRFETGQLYVENLNA